MDMNLESQFSNSASLDEERRRSDKEFDVQRESEIFANALIERHNLVSNEFNRLCAPLKEWTGGHFQVLPSQIILWSKALHREHITNGVSFGIKWTFYVFWPLRHGSSDGHGTNQRIIAQIDAAQVTNLEKSTAGLIPKQDVLHLKFMGFCSGSFEVLPDTTRSQPFSNIYPNLPVK